MHEWRDVVRSTIERLCKKCETENQTPENGNGRKIVNGELAGHGRANQNHLNNSSRRSRFAKNTDRGPTRIFLWSLSYVGVRGSPLIHNIILFAAFDLSHKLVIDRPFTANHPSSRL